MTKYLQLWNDLAYKRESVNYPQNILNLIGRLKSQIAQ